MAGVRLDPTPPERVDIDCSVWPDWKQRALESIKEGRGFRLVNAPLNESGALEEAANRTYFVNIVGHDTSTGIADAIHFVPYAGS